MTDRAEFEVELEDDVTPGARKAGSSLARLQRQFEKFNRSSVGRAVQRFASMAKNVIAIGSAMGAAVAAAIGATVVKMADFDQTSRLAFATMLGGIEAGNAAYERARALAQRFGLDVLNTVDQFKRFTGLGFNPAQSDALIRMGADMKVLGLNTEATNRVFSQLGQIFAKGKLQGEELIVLAENGLSIQRVYDALGRQLGKTREEIIRMQQAGEIAAGPALQAIASSITATLGTSDLGEGRLKAMQTLSGMWDVLRAKGQNFLLDVGGKLVPVFTRAFSAVSAELNAFFDSGGSKRFMAGIVSAFTSVAEAVRASIPFVKTFISAFSSGAIDAFVEMKNAFGSVLDMVTSNGGNSTRIIQMLGKSLGQLTVLIGATTVVLGGIAAALTTVVGTAFQFWRQQIENVSAWLGRLIFGVSDFFANLSAVLNSEGMNVFQKTFELGKMFVQGFLDGVRFLASAPVDLIKSVADGWIGALDSVFRFGSPSKVMEQRAVWAVEGWNNGMEDMPTIQGVSGMLGASSPAPMASVAGGSQQSIVVNLTVQAPPGGTQEDGRAWGEGLRESFRRQFFDELEGIALSDGV